MELRGAGGVIGAGLEPVDSAPRDEGAVNAQLLGADLGFDRVSHFPVGRTKLKLGWKIAGVRHSFHKWLHD